MGWAQMGQRRWITIHSPRTNSINCQSNFQLGRPFRNWVNFQLIRCYFSGLKPAIVVSCMLLESGQRSHLFPHVFNNFMHLHFTHVWSHPLPTSSWTNFLLFCVIVWQPWAHSAWLTCLLWRHYHRPTRLRQLLPCKPLTKIRVSGFYLLFMCLITLSLMCVTSFFTHNISLLERNYGIEPHHPLQ